LLISPLSPSHPHAIACRCPCVPNLTVDPITPAPCRRHSSSPAPVLPLRPRRHPKCHVPSQLKRIEITFVSMVHDISNVNALFLEGLLVNDMRIDYVIKGKWLAKLWQRQKEMILPPSHIKVPSFFIFNPFCEWFSQVDPFRKDFKKWTLSSAPWIMAPRLHASAPQIMTPRSWA
jgi:hypothetical protein